MGAELGHEDNKMTFVEALNEIEVKADRRCSGLEEIE
jgi:hypothetical protein